MIFKRKTIFFQGSRGGPTFSGGGGGGGRGLTFSRGWVQMAISIETYPNLGFPGRGPPIPLLDPRMFCLYL